MTYDIAIIGAGPAGLYAARELSLAGKSIILFEKNKLGGVSTHEGCIPAKTLLYSATMWDTAKDIEKFGMSLEGKISFDYEKIVQRKEMISKFIHQRIEGRLAELKVKLIKGFAHLNGEDSEGIKILSEGETYKAKKVLLSGGSKNFVPPIKGINESGYLEARTVMELKTVPSSMTVIGGGVLGIEFASLFATFGCRVDVVERSDEILSSNDKELAHLLRKNLERKGIKFHLNSSVNEVIGKAVIVTEEDGTEKKLVSDEILLATGRTPLVDNLNLESLRIDLTERKAVAVNNFMQTSHPSVYAFGDIIGRAMLVHAAVLEADTAIDHILGKESKLDYNIVPGVVYTNPEMSFVGAMEDKLIAKGITYKVVKAPLNLSDRFVQQKDVDEEGMIKILLSKEDDKILGVHILGYPGSEFITIAGIAIEEGWTRERLRKVVFPYPTVSRLLRDML